MYGHGYFGQSYYAGSYFAPANTGGGPPPITGAPQWYRISIQIGFGLLALLMVR